MSAAARIYARALFEAAEAAGRLEETSSDVQSFAQSLSETPRLLQSLQSPAVSAQGKARIIEAISGEGSRLVGNALQLMVDKGRAGELRNFTKAFEALMAAHRRTLKIQAITAVPLTGDAPDQLRERLSTLTKREVELTVKTEPGIIGGLILQMDGRVLDGSLKNKLSKLRSQLLAAHGNEERVFEATT